MKKRYILAALLAMFGWAPAAYAEDLQSPVLIAAIQTGQEGASGNDFITLHNVTQQPIDVTGWRLQYRAAGAVGATGWTTKRTIACTESQPGCTVVIAAGGTLLLSTYTLTGTASQPMSSGFSDVGGQIRLVRTIDSQVQVLDLLGYGTAVEAEGNAPAPAPLAGRVAMRASNEGRLIDTNNNSADFVLGCYDPLAEGVLKLITCEPAAPEEEETEQPPAPIPTEPEVVAPEPVQYVRFVLTELLPDPASPATDTADEFIEIFNPADTPADLAGYSVQAGSDFGDTYTFGTLVVPAGGYIVVTSAVTKISLTNSGTAVQLLDPSGEVISTVASYGAAKSGKSWAKDPTDAWLWTAPTPGAPNSFSPEPSAAVLAAAAAVKKATTKKATVTNAAKPKAAKAAVAGSTKAAAKTPPAGPAAPATQQESHVPFLILGVVGLGVLAYAIYEYRQDIARLYRRIKDRLTARKDREPTLQTD